MKVAIMKIMDNFRYKWKPSHATTLFVVSKDEWDTNEDTSKMHCMYSSMAKGTSQVEVMSNSEKNQTRSFSHC